MSKKRAATRKTMTVTTVAIETVVYRELERIAFDERVAITELVREAVRQLVNQRKKGGRRA